MRQGVRGRACLLGFSLSLLAFMAGCHSAGMQSTTGTTTQPVTVTPGSAPGSLTVGQTYQFSATVANSNNTGVTWSVNSVAGGNATVGTVSSSGLYTAPALVPAPQTITITATSQADTTKSASFTVTINIALSVSLAGSGASTVSLQVTASQVFNATVVGAANTNVVWYAHKIPVSVCGEMAGDPVMTALLLGLGVDELSAAPSLVPTLKFMVRRLKTTEAGALAEFALGCESGEEILARCQALRGRKRPGAVRKQNVI